MVERAAAGEAPSSPQPREAGARRARFEGASPAADNRNRQTMPSSRCGASVRNAASGSASADFEHVVDLPLAARCGLAARLRAFDLPLADLREDGAEVLVLDDGGLRNLPQLVKGGVRQVEPAVADRQPAVGIIDHGDALAAELAGDLVRFEQEQNLVILQGQAVGNRSLLAPGEDVSEVVAGCQGPMEVLGIVRLLTEAGVVIGQETRQQLIAGGNRANPLKTQFLDQAILQGLVGALDAALCLRCVGAQNVDVEGVQRAPKLGHAVALDGPGVIDPKDAVLVAVERYQFAMRLEILAGRPEVVEGRFRLDELQMHQAAGGVVDIDQQRALRTAALEPPMLGAVDLHQLTQTITPCPRLVDALQSVFSPNPKAGADHPLPQCLDPKVQAMKLAQLLGRQGRTKIRVALPHDSQHGLAEHCTQSPVARAAALARNHT